MTINLNEKLKKCDEKWLEKLDKLSEEFAKMYMDINKNRYDIYEMKTKRMEALRNCDKYPNDWKKYLNEWMEYQEDWNTRQEELDKQLKKHIQKFKRTRKYYGKKRNIIRGM